MNVHSTGLEVLAAEYNRIIIFKGPIADKVLRGHVIRREKVANEGGCRVKCFLEPNCVSINVGPAVAGNRSCELNNDTDESQSLLSRKKNFVHYSVENICKMKGDPCPATENKSCQVGFTDKRYRCVCRDGYRKRPTDQSDQCVDINECKEDIHDCQQDTENCAAQKSHRCPPNSECVNELGSYRCDCKDGFEKVGATCKDVDECQSDNRLWWCTPEHNRECINTLGSFRCGCILGFAPHGKRWQCKECQNALGMESGNISDGQISASSEWNTTHYADQCRVATTYYANQWDATHYAHQGRLQFKADGVRGGAWSAAENDVNPWLQVDLVSNFTRVTGLATQGRDDYDWWVIEYKLLYSSYQNSNFENYKEMGHTVAKVFAGNNDRSTAVRHNLTKLITSRYIRLKPTKWHNHISMRLELYGCYDVDECHDGSHDCHSDATCKNTVGYFTCNCKDGYRGDGRNCEDVNECNDGSHDCHSDATCINTAGYFTCQCKHGYSGDGRNCKDVNECNDGSHDCHSDATCKNTAGHFSCQCKHGYSGDGRNCEDLECQTCLGMENGNIADTQITASSEYKNGGHYLPAFQGRLHLKATAGNRKGAWAARDKDVNQWLQVDLDSYYVRVTGVATQGREDSGQWVKNYKLQFSNDTETSSFQTYVGKGQDNEKIFDGNSDQNTVVRHNLTEAITARYIRFQPTEWHKHISMRVELYGCYAENWKKINTNPVCFGAKADSYGTFNILESGVIYTFKLVHQNGSLSCNPDYPSSYWGCDAPVLGEERLFTVITFQNRSALSLADYRRNGCNYYSYNIEDVGVNQPELQFNILPYPISVSVGDEFQIWHGQDLKGCSENNNSGQTCADVYALYA